MEYIVNKTVDLINEKTITNDNEAIIRIDGFEDISFYENVASKITNEFKNSNLKIDIKLAKNKWIDFKDENNVIQESIDILNFLKIKDFTVLDKMEKQVLFKKINSEALFTFNSSPLILYRLYSFLIL